MRFTSSSFAVAMPATHGGTAAPAHDAVIRNRGFSELSHTGVYRVSTVDGRRTTGISGMLFLREDRACVLRLAVPTDKDRTLIRLVRGIWWPVALGVKVMTSDGLVSVWPASRKSLVVRLPLKALRGEARETTATELKFVRVR